MARLVCWNCGTPLDDIPRPISRHANCPECFNELHCCRLCLHFKPEIGGRQCEEDRADPPVVKENANFCDWFRPAMERFNTESGSRSDEARARLDALFGHQAGTQGATETPEPEPPNDQDRARAEIERLFSSKPEKGDG